MPELLSRAPLIVLVRGALDAEACAALLSAATQSIDAGKESDTPGAKRRATLGASVLAVEQAGLAKLNADVSALLGAELGPWTVHSTRQGPCAGPRDASLGLHVDTLHAPRRFVTALLYLTSVAEGGGTLFPLAGAGGAAPWSRMALERAASASQLLLDAGVEHTHEVSRAFPRSDGILLALDLLEARVKDPSCGLTVQPVAGDMVLFFTRDQSGGVDARSWHGGAAVVEGSKWTLQNFMEVPLGTPPAGEPAYICARRSQLIGLSRPGRSAPF